MDYYSEHMLIVDVGTKRTYNNKVVDYVTVINSRGKKHSFAKRYFLTIAKPIGQKMSETIKKTS